MQLIQINHIESSNQSQVCSSLSLKCACTCTLLQLIIYQLFIRRAQVYIAFQHFHDINTGNVVHVCSGQKGHSFKDHLNWGLTPFWLSTDNISCPIHTCTGNILFAVFYAWRTSERPLFCTKKKRKDIVTTFVGNRHDIPAIVFMIESIVQNRRSDTITKAKGKCFIIYGSCLECVSSCIVRTCSTLYQARLESPCVYRVLVLFYALPWL